MSTIARLTLDEYYRMVDAAVFERDRRIELIHSLTTDQAGDEVQPQRFPEGALQVGLLFA
ncbi:MAG TPA: hypothetical protein VG826_22145 [Pirellulales bacterium]|nr:hypothetical protein [Pirellulales bacterium]